MPLRLLARARSGRKVACEEDGLEEDDEDDLPCLHWWEKGFLIVAAVAFAVQGALYLGLGGERLRRELLWIGESNLQRREFPTFHAPPEGSLSDLRHERSGAVTTVTLPDGTKTSFMMNAPGGPEGHERLPDFFYGHTVYGITAWDPPNKTPGNWTYNLEINSELESELRTMWPPPDEVLYCQFENADVGWRAEGFCPCYESTTFTADAESRMRIAARRYHQALVFKWWPHRWGRADTGNLWDGVTIMQSTVPTTPSLVALRTSGPVWGVPA